MQLTEKAEPGSATRALPQLTYCTNIHAGEAWSQLISSLRECVPSVRQSLGANQLGVGLRLGQAAARALDNPVSQQELQDFLADGFSVFTVNAFPYGPFHGEPVKENVYAPDWSTPERLAYTNQVAELLAAIAPREGGSSNFASISTVPGSYKPWVAGREESIRSNFVECVARLVDIERNSGVHIALALEPEPFCMLETIDETVEWFKKDGFSVQSCEQLARLCRVTTQQAEQLLRRHLGVCYDVCHAAVEFEDARESFAKLLNAGISIPKIQLSSALRVSSMDRDIATRLAAFNEPVYLHQVIQRSNEQAAQQGQGSLRRILDLPQALQQLEEDGTGEGAEWRVHFHVPVFLDRLEHFDTTQFFLREVLALVREQDLSPHLEVETYTWDVLPADLRNTDISTAIAREMQWVLDQLNYQPQL